MRYGWVGFCLSLLASFPASANEKVRILLDWKADAERGGYYQALATGLYQKRGLDVTILQGGPGIDAQQIIAAGAVDFAQASNSFAPLNLIQVDAPFKAVMGLFQRSPQILIAHPDPGINSIADMKGRPILLAPSALQTLGVWLTAKFGLTENQYHPMGTSLTPWVVNPAAIAQGYATSDPYVLEAQGVEAKYFLLADYGYSSYGAIVIASDKLIDEKPAVVQAFVDATIEGWRSYLDGDPKPGLDLVKSLNDDATDQRNAEVIKNIKRYHLVDGDDAQTLGIGAMTDAKWRTFFEVMAQIGIYPTDLDYRKAFTLQFIAPKPAVASP